ncbi:hypothetical protein F5890DRAFT_1540765 [Lentinula detonsa]|uniref:Uncharacterized protein n=1 Tax=Lentinula detonsa TaxID=2804962 RepID=A0AA38UN62_9AGAR|nr:hypothetical protein F5890DRAFT_1540765 [Lentinula detonsa]
MKRCGARKKTFHLLSFICRLSPKLLPFLPRLSSFSIFAMTLRERRPWSPEEDDLLRAAVLKEEPGNLNPSKWFAISTHVPGRTNKDCRKRWFARMAADIVRGVWSADEDAKLLSAVEKYGTKWSLVATMVHTRNSDQCAKRWTDTLDPTIDRSGWTPEQDHTLLDAVNEHGTCWKKIVKTYFPGKTGLSAKNRYTSLTRIQNSSRPIRRSQSTDDDTSSTSSDRHTPFYTPPTKHARAHSKPSWSHSPYPRRASSSTGSSSTEEHYNDVNQHFPYNGYQPADPFYPADSSDYWSTAMQLAQIQPQGLTQYPASSQSRLDEVDASYYLYDNTYSSMTVSPACHQRQIAPFCDPTSYVPSNTFTTSTFGSQPFPYDHRPLREDISAAGHFPTRLEHPFEGDHGADWGYA